MLSSIWTINRIGLIDFWYYDNEEFIFEDGRMLLRGSNGSGKSVTMQSFIPLLLDGNKSPNRLDPFGTRARKLENYLLEENDSRDERCGYLYMEFKRSDSNTYLTLGMGLRARTGKPLESWYFNISDGRRVGKTIELFKKDDSNKICLTKAELKARIREGGQVFDKQSEYMEMVNKQLFGFASIDEYKEMVDLLIQLRTPKLSKDFKPTILNEILSNSLQVLSDDDLRPMSEAIENMDNLKTNLDNLEESKKASDKIMKVYDQYNKVTLLEKLKKYIEYTTDLRKLKSTAKDLEKSRNEMLEVLETNQNTQIQLEEEQEKLDNQRQNLQKSHAAEIEIKENLEKLTSELAKQRIHYNEKSNDLELKKEKQIKIEKEIKDKKSQVEILADEISKIMDNLDSCGDEINFSEQNLMRDEFNKNIDNEFDFTFTKQATNTLENHIKEGITLLKKQEEKSKQYDEALEKYDMAYGRRENQYSLFRQAQEQFIEIKAELIEKINIWVDKNIELDLKSETLIHLHQEINRFPYTERFLNLKEMIESDYDINKNKLQAYKINEEVFNKSLLTDKEEKETKLYELETTKELEPERSTQVIANRLRLKELHIPHIPFYKLINYKENIGEEIINHTEEALIQMGILDALVVPDEYKEKVLKSDKGLHDKYIFSNQIISDNLSNLLYIDENSNENEFYTSLSETLKIIGYNCETGHTNINENGEYVLGIISGNISRNYVSKYIGENARERNRLHTIELLNDELKELEEKLNISNEKIISLEERIQSLIEEYNKIPSSEDTLIAANEVRECEVIINKINEELKFLESEKQQLLESLNTVKREVLKLSEIINIPLDLKLYESGLECISVYKDYLKDLEISHNKYRMSKGILMSNEEQLIDCEDDIETILYDINIIEKSIRSYEGNIASLNEQLSLSGYEEVQEQINNCIKRLKEIPEEAKILVRSATMAEGAINDNNKKLEEIKETFEVQNQKNQLIKEAAIEEHNLLYTDIQYINFEEDTKVKEAIGILEADTQNNKDKTALLTEVQKQFFANRENLAEYSMTLDNIFEEIPLLNDITIRRIDITCKLQGQKVKFKQLLNELTKRIDEQSALLKESDREIFEDILTNTISKKISAKIYMSEVWVEKMNTLMKNMNTSSGLTLSLSWKNKKAESEEQLGTNELVALLKKDAVLMKDSDIDRLAKHFRSKINEARKRLEDDESTQTFHSIMKDILDYRKWFEFQLSYKKTGDNKKELTDREFFKFSGGEKAMSMYVPLFSAVVAKYQGARDDAPRLISLDEAFAGVDDMNIKDMFKLMVEFKFNFIINSQVLWGDYETVPKLAIYQLLRPNNVKYVTVIRYLWNGHSKVIVTNGE